MTRPQSLRFSALRAANIARLPTFRNAQGGPAHSQPDGSDWALSTWSNAMFGEIGEVAEVLDYKSGEVAAFIIGEELADVMIYLDILAFRCGIDLGKAIHRRTVICHADNDGSMDFATMRLHLGHPTLRLHGDAFRALCWYSGAAANVLKKVERGDITLPAALEPLTNHYVDAVFMLDALAKPRGIDLGVAVMEKFNRTSEKVGSPIRLAPDGFWHLTPSGPAYHPVKPDPAPSWRPTHRHRNGSDYREVLRGAMEADYPSTPVVIYDDAQGRIFVRPAAEFDDGRFSRLDQGSPS
ncbi:hypothetical protein [Azospirillum sp. B4]|uniref:hypothetical protein n=1 Tax=Azospirillum sp. B4 TaxID=95605 RepID=UPI000345A5A8|nr:hypothetical protein [Azospirillum sp. B4]